jgi:hypothetical protein
MTATKIKAEALRILTAPGGPCDPFAEDVKDPDLMLQIIKESLDVFVDQNPGHQHNPEKLAEAFLLHMDEIKSRPRDR